MKGKRASKSVRLNKQESCEVSVYFGRRRLGRYARVATERYAAFDAMDRPLGNFRKCA